MTAGPLPAGPAQVFNRSDRVWVYGYVRMAPLILLFGGLGLLAFLHHHFKRIPDEVAVALVFICLIGPFVLDRLPWLNPVNYVVLGQSIQVTRLAGRPRNFPTDRVIHIELAPREGEEYDDRKPARGGMDATIRFRRAWPVRLLVSPADATALADWARRLGKPVQEAKA